MPVEITNKKTGEKSIMDNEKADKVKKSNIGKYFYFKDLPAAKTPPEVVGLKKGKPVENTPKPDTVN